MSQIASQIKVLKETLPPYVHLIAVSKYHPVSSIMEAYDAGQRIFGENRVQELVDKAPQLPDDIEWHLIGTLQRNKVKYVVPFVHTIQSVDSPRLLEEIEKQCVRLGREVIDVLLQVHISGEETKHGFSIEELKTFLAEGGHRHYPHIRITGLMAMASLTDDDSKVEQEFAEMKQLFDTLKTEYFGDSEAFRHLSIGMSDDYPIAIRYGATYVRVGTKIFGEREY
ncbi:YggS family pyridoxal phosphate-dependent enzyme [Porphyromonas sp.]|uniref:YggS family pyridoxal phosphate-dependent enzyme n=1 Tax=Porphyromonas sp. TaxID=1924944 RepID=UPI0026DD1C09|nr:YggS family pyridoxal phosphate-dependent enzyme [Porphyromonas sp.]MDO4770385.1 YggS family pyridoxal phosphate-dependent enzyme [Porphyromonas sp.]